MHRTHPVRTAAIASALGLASILGACTPGEGTRTDTPAFSSPTADRPEQPGDVLAQAIEAVETTHFTVLSASTNGAFAIAGQLDLTSDVRAVSATTMADSDTSNETRIISVGGDMWRNEGVYSADKWYLVPNPPPLWDPLRDLPGLVEAAETVVHTGQADLDGLAVEQYTVTIDTDLLTDELLATGPIPADGATYEIYLDRNGVLVGYDNEMDGSAIESRLTAVNEEVSIDPPPADLVMSPEVAELLYGLG